MSATVVGRNDPCPCGSGRRFKHCCGQMRSAPSIVTAQQIGTLVQWVQQGHAAQAEQSARQLLQQQPESGILWKVMGVARLRQGKDALAALQRAAQLLPGDAEAHANLGAALCDRREWAAALETLRRAVTLGARGTDVLVDAGNAQAALQRPQEAQELYRQALALDPRCVPALRGLANSLMTQGDAAAAVEAYRQVLLVAPGDAESLFNLAQILSLQGERREALPLLQRAVAAAPDSAEGHFRLGHALLGARRASEACDSFRAALALQPRHVGALIGLASAQRVSGQALEARRSSEAALAVDPSHAGALALSGQLRADAGAFAEARQLFERALQRDPKLVSAYAGIADLRRMDAADEGWYAAVTALLARGVSAADEAVLQFALGKFCDDVARYEEAFDHYRRANELARRQASPYDGAQFARLIEGVARLCAARGRPGSSGEDNDRPVFIIGMPRSGTSLVEQILSSHPEVFGAGEVRFWDGAYGLVTRALNDERDSNAVLREVAQDYLTRIATHAGKATRVIDKMPANFIYAGLIHAALPRARFIHMQRDPRDTCLSVYFQNFYNVSPYAHDLADLADYYRQYQRIMAHWRRVLPADRLLEVPYEGLIGEQRDWTQRLLEFIDLPWDERCLRFEQTERVVITASRWQVRQKLHGGSIGRWRHYQQHLGPLQALAAP